MTKTKKLRWVEIDGMKYVGVDVSLVKIGEWCDGCAFLSSEMDRYCQQVDCRPLNSKPFFYIPLEVQHIPNLRKVGKTKWQN